MIELAQHIEALLLENDCVIVPDLGGFVAHYTPAMRVEEEHIFLPPARIIGFNPQLKMNDGLLVQSYMAVYGTSFSDATKIVAKEVDKLFVMLHEEGKADLPNIGELHYSIHNKYDFVPYDHKITTPDLYGLDSFEIKELAALVQPVEKRTIPFTPATTDEEKRRLFEIKVSRSYLTNAVAMIAVIALFFFLSTPIENTEVIQGNYAQMLPGELFEKIEKQSLATTPITVQEVKREVPKGQAQSGPSSRPKNKVVPVAVKEIKVGQPKATTSAIPAPRTKDIADRPHATVTPKAVVQAKQTQTTSAVVVPSKSYHIIVASVGTEKDAELMAKDLVKKGFAGAKAIIGDGKMRVSIESCNTEIEAYKALAKIRQNEAYQSAWVLKK